MLRFRGASEYAVSRRAIFKFRLYVADDAQNGLQAIANLTALCRAYLPDRHSIEIVDVLKEPKRALAERIFMTPTLIKLAPSPVRRIVGTLSHTQTVLLALGLELVAA
jgi:circadian clock protein KaiB